jgi:hypothetical protein
MLLICILVLLSSRNVEVGHISLKFVEFEGRKSCEMTELIDIIMMLFSG